jgi:hypothetical protein
MIVNKQAAPTRQATNPTAPARKLLIPHLCTGGGAGEALRDELCEPAPSFQISNVSFLWGVEYPNVLLAGHGHVSLAVSVDTQRQISVRVRLACGRSISGVQDQGCSPKVFQPCVQLVAVLMVDNRNFFSPSQPPNKRVQCARPACRVAVTKAPLVFHYLFGKAVIHKDFWDGTSLAGGS